MSKLIAFLCFVSLAVLSSADFSTQSRYSDLENKLQQLFKNKRQDFAAGFKGLPPLDPAVIPGPFALDADPFEASVSSITVTGLSSFNDTFLKILSNGIWILVVDIPQISVQGSLTIEVPQSPFKGNVQATLTNVTVIINGFASVNGDELSISEVHSDVSINENPSVKVVGLPGSNQFLNTFASQYLTNNLGNMINNNSDIYEAALDAVIKTYLSQALGTSYNKFVNTVNSMQ